MMRTSSILCVIVSLILLIGCKDGQKTSKAIQSENNRGERGDSELPRIPVASSTSLPDGIGPIKLGISKEEFEALKKSLAGREGSPESQTPGLHKFSGNFVTGELYQVDYGIEGKWETVVVEETIKRYGQPVERLTLPDIVYGAAVRHYRLIWKDANHELGVEYQEWPPEMMRTMRRVVSEPLGPYIFYQGWVADLRLKAKHNLEVEMSEKAQERAAKEKYEQEKADVIKKLY